MVLILHKVKFYNARENIFLETNSKTMRMTLKIAEHKQATLALADADIIIVYEFWFILVLRPKTYLYGSQLQNINYKILLTWKKLR